MIRNQPSSSEFSLQMKKALERLELDISELGDSIAKETHFKILFFVLKGKVDFVFI